MSVGQIVGILNGDDPRQSFGLGCLDEFHQAPGRFIGNANMPDFAFINQLAQYSQRFLDRNAGTFIFGIEDHFSEKRDIPAGPVQLVEIDIICFQPSQAAFNRQTDVFFIQVVFAIA